MKDLCFGLNEVICFVEECFDLLKPEANSGPYQTSKIKFSTKIVKSFRLFTTNFGYEHNILFFECLHLCNLIG